MPSKWFSESEIVVPQSSYVSTPLPRALLIGGSAHQLLVEALVGVRCVDFATITDICELIWNDPEQRIEVVNVLSSAMRHDNDVTKQLRATTVAHELLYDAGARRAMYETPGMIQTLARLQHGGDQFNQGPAREAVRMLASEVMRRLLEEFTFHL
uniref:Uncharacterized protein n=1 Tax=Noctiluca scintillans TaxID=2966 RepID=A0A7S1AC71_NOCSC